MKMAGAAQERALLHLVGLIYDAATDAAKWEPALEAMVRVFGAKAGQINYVDDEIRELAFSAHFGLDERLLPKYAELMPEDPRTPVSARYPGKPLLWSRTIDPELWENSRFNRELFVPAGLGDSMTFWFRPEDGGYVAAGLIRATGAAPFDDSDAAVFGELIPHIRRAATLHRRLLLLDASRQAAFHALDAVPVGVVLVDKPDIVLFANQAAREVADRDGLIISHGRIWATDTAARGELVLAVTRAIDRARAGEILPGRAISVRRATGREPLGLMVAPLWGRHLAARTGDASRPLAAVFISDPGRPVEAPGEVLQRLFGLTPAEAGVLERIVRGATVNATARELGISLNTARSHMKSLFAKTGTNRQAELIRLVLASPAWMRVNMSE